MRREVDARTPDQTTALMEACSNGHADVVHVADVLYQKVRHVAGDLLKAVVVEASSEPCAVASFAVASLQV